MGRREEVIDGTGVGGAWGELRDWADLRLARAGDRGVVVAALVAGGLADLAVRSGVAGAAGAALVAVVAVLLLVVGRPAGRQAQGLTLASVVFGGFLALRSSPWLLPLDILAAGGLLVLGAALSRGGSVLDLPLPGLVARGLHAALHGLAAPAFAWDGTRRGEGSRAGDASGGKRGERAPERNDESTSGGGWLAAGRGLALAAPVIAVLGALLASADVLFAHLFEIVPDIDDTAAHLVLAGLGAWGMTGLLRVGAARPPGPLPGRLAVVGRVETGIVVGSVAVLLGTFAVTQLVALAGGGRHVLSTAGLTYAEYARSGFFQLVAVSAITLALLLMADTVTAGGLRSRSLLVASEACVGLTLVVVASALRRLDLYENAYGLTMLRLFVAVFVVWLGVALVLLGACVATDRLRMWFPATAAAGLAAVVALNVINPEAVVVRRNVALAEQSGRFDSGYLLELSDDAVPELARALPRLAPDARAVALDQICGSRSQGSSPGGWAAWNAGRAAAADTRARVCPR